MSRGSLKYNLNESRYNLKTFIYIFIILDVNIYFFIPIFGFMLIVGNELSLLIGLYLGIRGQGNLKEFVYDLRAIAYDPLYDEHEDVRGHKLKQQINYATLEWDAWFFRKSKSNKKKTKKIKQKKGVIKYMLWDEVVHKQAGYALVAILALFGGVFAYWIEALDWSLILVIALAGTWEILDGFLFFYIHYIFNIEPQEMLVKDSRPAIMMNNKPTKEEIKTLLKS